MGSWAQRLGCVESGKDNSAGPGDRAQGRWDGDPGPRQHLGEAVGEGLPTVKMWPLKSQLLGEDGASPCTTRSPRMRGS